MSVGSAADDDGCASMMSTSEVSGPSSANSSRKRKSTSGPVTFKAWNFRLTVDADLGHGSTAEENGKLLTEHFHTRTGHTRPPSVTCVAVFCDTPPDSAGLVSIEVQGYVQASHVKPHSTMKKWIESATWKPVPGGLSSDAEYQTNMDKFNDPNDSMTRLMVFGGVGANNAGQAAEGQGPASPKGRLPDRKLSTNRQRICIMLSFELLSIFDSQIYSNIITTAQSARD
jgi:hypothetical protein